MDLPTQEMLCTNPMWGGVPPTITPNSEGLTVAPNYFAFFFFHDRLTHHEWLTIVKNLSCSVAQRLFSVSPGL